MRAVPFNVVVLREIKLQLKRGQEAMKLYLLNYRINQAQANILEWTMYIILQA